MLIIYALGAIASLSIINWLIFINADENTEIRGEAQIGAYISGGLFIFCIVWLIRWCFEWDPSTDVQSGSSSQHRFITTLLITISIMLIPRIIRGVRVIWSEWKDTPPISWWLALPDWCGWAIVMSGFALFGHFWPQDRPSERYPWFVTIGMIGMFWSMVGITHAVRAIDRILSAHFDNRRLRREQRLRTEGRDEPFQAP